MSIIPYPTLGLNLPVGWTNPTLEQQLFAYGQQSQRILEIGSFVGRSTAVIAHGIKARGDREVIFDTCDLHFANTTEFRQFYAKVYGSQLQVPDLQRKFLGKSQETLKVNLQKLGLDTYVNCLKGCFIDLSQNSQLLNSYDMIHCDVAHDMAEINYNCPYLAKLLSKTRSVLICDNIRTPEQVEAIRKLIPLTDYQLINTTFVGRIYHTPTWSTRPIPVKMATPIRPILNTSSKPKPKSKPIPELKPIKAKSPRKKTSVSDMIPVIRFPKVSSDTLRAK